jgi:hypothetical protein
VPTTLFRLTERGRALEPVIKVIGDWVRPHLARVDEHDFQFHWLVLPLRFNAQDAPPTAWLHSSRLILHAAQVRSDTRPSRMQISTGAFNRTSGCRPEPAPRT